MLGRLRMSVKDCKKWYIRLAKDAFTPIYSSYNAVGKLLGKIQAKPAFDEKKLEDAIQNIVLAALEKDVKLQSTPRYKRENANKMNDDTLFFHPEQSEKSCKT